MAPPKKGKLVIIEIFAMRLCKTSYRRRQDHSWKPRYPHPVSLGPTKNIVVECVFPCHERKYKKKKNTKKKKGVVHIGIGWCLVVVFVIAPPLQRTRHHTPHHRLVDKFVSSLGGAGQNHFWVEDEREG